MSETMTQLRIKVNLVINDGPYVEEEFKLWHYLDTSQVRTVEEFKNDFIRKLIQNKILNHTQIDVMRLTIDDYDLPLFESIYLIRDLDLIKIHCASDNFSNNQESSKRKIETKPSISKRICLEKDDEDWDVNTSQSSQAEKQISKPFEACLIGSSMVKHINPTEIFKNRKCFFKSISGGRTKHVLEFLKSRLHVLEKCSCFVVTVGSNDCDSKMDIKEIIDDYIELAQYLNKTYPEAKLVFNKLVPRTRTLYTDIEEFDRRRTCFNNFLDSTLSALINCIIVTHDKFESANEKEINTLLADGVHLSKLTGLPTYVEKLKNTISDLYKN